MRLSIATRSLITTIGRFTASAATLDRFAV